MKRVLLLVLVTSIYSSFSTASTDYPIAAKSEGSPPVLFSLTCIVGIQFLDIVQTSDGEYYIRLERMHYGGEGRNYPAKKVPGQDIFYGNNFKITLKKVSPGNWTGGLVSNGNYRDVICQH